MGSKFHINPRHEVSVKKALIVGTFLLILLPIFGMVAPVLVSIILSKQQIIPEWGIGFAIFLGLILGRFFWSFSITKWKIRAYSRVLNVNELKTRAIEDKLIWPDEKWFNKTEISTRIQRQKLL